ncbi:c-type cytochrome [Microlunatus elymi]|uniref:Cytochrome bc1 complex cytochrome c subunit n=1 Tax=Microlunatus elymi TaxID=2596828 RepID=A0A516Q2L6_9ACTN|nr:c-type cytochrome [Microlunatus elymi]QDP97648.1 c-type cytochrome [Microlunatus elymi]
MRFLSSRRRHPAAKVLLLVAALFAVGALYAAVAPTEQSSAEPATSQQVTEGRELFSVNCSSCHGLNGEGTSQGPTLQGVGAAAVDFQVSTGRMPLAQPGQQAPVKPREFTDDEVAALAAFVATLGPGPAVPDSSQYSTEGLTDEQIAEGGELFRTNCSACHNFTGQGGALPEGKHAPSLVGVSNKHLYEAMLTGPQQMPVFSDEVLTSQDKRQIIAYLDALHQRPNEGGLNLGSIGPVSEGVAVWTIGIGCLIGFAVWITARGARAR